MNECPRSALSCIRWYLQHSIYVPNLACIALPISKIGRMTNDLQIWMVVGHLLSSAMSASYRAHIFYLLFVVTIFPSFTISEVLRTRDWSKKFFTTSCVFDILTEVTILEFHNDWVAW